LPAIEFLGYYVAQSWSALTMLNKVLNENKDITRVVELGTGTGGLTLLLGLNMLTRNGKVLTLDIGMPQALKWFDHLNIHFEKKDVFMEDTVKMVADFIGDERTLIFCDNGNKAKEFPLYARLLKKRDLIMAHDWTTEITRNDLDEKTLSSLEPYLQDEFDKEFTLILSMRKTR